MPWGWDYLVGGIIWDFPPNARYVVPLARFNTLNLAVTEAPSKPNSFYLEIVMHFIKFMSILPWSIY